MFTGYFRGLRLGSDGPALYGVNAGDIPVWDVNEGWTVGPGTGVALSGDANGPAAANEVNSLSPSVGGSNIPLGDFTSDPGDPRIVVRAPAGGDIETRTLASLGLRQAFDFILETRADLVAAVGAPVGTDFQMVPGSYALKQGFALDPGERLVFPATGAMFVMGMGAGKELSGTPGSGNALVEIETGAIVDLIGLSLVASGNGSEALHVHGATVRTQSCRFTANATGGTAARVDNADAWWSDFASRFESQQDNFIVLGGRLRFSHSRFIGGLGNCLDVQAPSLVVLASFHNCDFEGGSASAVSNTAPNGDMTFVDCDCRVDANGVNVINLNDTSSFQWVGGIIASTAGTPGDGIRFNGNVSGGAQIIGVTFENLDDAIQYQAGVQRRVTIVGCDSAANVATGVDWAAANIPTNGLLISGCQFDTATPFQNFIETDARVNRKVNSLQSTLSSETPIVP